MAEEDVTLPKSYFNKFDFKEKYSGEGDTNLSEWLEIFEINC